MVEQRKVDGIKRQINALAADPHVDVEDLVLSFGQVRAALDAAEQRAVTHLRERGHSWAHVGKALGITRQAAQQRYGRPTR